MKQDRHVHVCHFKYQVEVSLPDVNNPAIWRYLSIPHTATFEELHEALQIAFSWRPSNDWGFGVDRLLITSGDRITTLASDSGREVVFTLKDARTTYLVEVMKDAFWNRKIFGYLHNSAFGPMHKIILRAATWPGYHNTNIRTLSDFRCTGGTGHPFAQGFDLDQWKELKSAYSRLMPTQ